MRMSIIPLIAIAPLAACGGNINEDDAPDTEVVENGGEVAEIDAQPLRPGLWALSETIGEVDQATMRGSEEAEIEEDPARRGAVRSICLPDDYADRPHPDFWAGSENACQYDDFTMADGELTATLTCNATPGTITLTLNGDYSATGFDLAMTTARRGTGSEDVTVNGRLEGEWMEACDPEEG